ncbi:hypothetical protein B0J18DRAFT_419380 [Chaetomium sp. MPI-SDFR-AT-0129]|nr:hypothetical protein B0J18DRAFT_419380 [Chaetomium sp. MPI-SDFR-AT-0129]
MWAPPLGGYPAPAVLAPSPACTCHFGHLIFCRLWIEITFHGGIVSIPGSYKPHISNILERDILSVFVVHFAREGSKSGFLGSSPPCPAVKGQSQVAGPSFLLHIAATPVLIWTISCAPQINQSTCSASMDILIFLTSGLPHWGALCPLAPERRGSRRVA